MSKLAFHGLVLDVSLLHYFIPDSCPFFTKTAILLPSRPMAYVYVHSKVFTKYLEFSTTVTDLRLLLNMLCIYLPTPLTEMGLRVLVENYF